MTRAYAHALLNAVRDGTVDATEERIREALRVTGDLGPANEVLHLRPVMLPSVMTSGARAGLLAWCPA